MLKLYLLKTCQLPVTQIILSHNLKKINHGYCRQLASKAGAPNPKIQAEDVLLPVEKTHPKVRHPQKKESILKSLLSSYYSKNSAVKKAPEIVAAADDIYKEIKLVNALTEHQLDWKKMSVDVRDLPGYYMKLAKIRLTGLVVATTMFGYAMSPGLCNYETLVLACVGTALMSAAANTLNQFLEVPFDSQMTRTKNRVLVRWLISPMHAITFAAVCSCSGIAILAASTNILTAALGALNLVLYSFVYTPLKRCTIANTWVGSVVGAIPPVMGWTAATATIDPGALLMGAMLFAWQFPHFNALSWNLRGDYSRAGYRMMSVTHPDLCRSTTLRYSVAMTALCVAAPLVDLTSWTFSVDSLPVNLYLVYLSWRFYQQADSANSRKLFKYSLVHLPLVMILLLISKKRPHKDEISPKKSAVKS